MSVNTTNITIPPEVLIAGGGILTSIGLVLIAMLFWYIIIDSMFRDQNLKRTTYDTLIYQQVLDFFILFGLIFVSIFNFLATLVAASFYWTYNNLYLLAGILMASSASAVFLQYHDVALKGWLQFRQCFSRFFIDLELFPIVNMIRLIYNTFIGIWNGAIGIYRFFVSGHWRVILACFRVNGFLIPLNSFTQIFIELVNDFLDFVLLGTGIFSDRWNIQNTLTAISNFLISLAPYMICFCSILDFLWVDIASIVSLNSLNIAADAVFNILVRILQIPINSVFTLSLPKIDKVTVEVISFLINAGDFIEDTIFILLESFFSVLSIYGTIPDAVLQFFNAQYMRVITQPLSCLAILINMTVEAAENLQAIQAPDRSGIAYFQFGQIIDRLKDAAAGFAQLFIIIGTGEECFVREGLYVIIDVLAIFLEMIPGALFFFFLPTCCNNPLDFFVEYWFTPGNTLVLIFSQIEFVTQCVRDILSDLNPPFACSVQHLINIIVELLKIITQMLIFSLSIITFQPFPTLLDINIDPLFTEFILWCQCTADIIRQFDAEFCVPIPGDNKQNLVCCIGNFLIALCNLFSNLLKQVIEFIFDIITLPSGTIIISNIRIPIFNDAIQFTKNATCELACAITSVVPLSLTCQFINPNITCDRPSGCGATLICTIVNGLLIPAQLLNNSLIKLRVGDFFGSLYVWLVEPVTLITQWVADVIDFLGAFLDCIICAALDNGVNCTDATYQVTHEVALLLPTIRPFFTSVFMIIIKIVLALIKGLFVDGQPIGAIIEAVFQFLAQVVGSLGPALVNFIVSLLNRIGLNFLGSFINALWLGLCPTLEFVTNAVIAIILVLTFGLVNLPFVNYCCNAVNCTIQPSKRSVEEGGINEPYINDSVIYPTMDTWVKTFTKYLLQWNTTDPCNITMATYADMKFEEMTKLDVYNSLYCIMKIYWPHRNDNQTTILSSKCDQLFENYLIRNIDFKTDLRLDEQLNVMDCIESRIVIDGIRIKSQLLWIPSDILTNPWRKFYFAGEIVRGLSVYFQYFSDRSTDPSNLLKPEYKQRWIQSGLNVTYLENLSTVDDVKNLLSSTDLIDYFEWNNATQYNAVVWLTIGFWNTTGSMIELMIQSIVANSNTDYDNLTGILLGNPEDTSTVMTTSFFGILHEILSAFQKITDYWSNLNNLKRNIQTFNIVSRIAKNRFYDFVKYMVNFLSSKEYEVNEEDEFLFENKTNNDNEIKKGIVYSRGRILNYFYTWYDNHFPKIYKRDEPINYLQHFKEKLIEENNLSETYIRTLLVNTLKLSNRSDIDEMIFNMNDYEFNKKMTDKDYNQYSNNTRWIRVKTIFSEMFQGTKYSEKKWNKLRIFYNHFANIFNDFLERLNYNFEQIELEKLNIEKFILQNVSRLNDKESFHKEFNFDVEKIVYDDYDQQFIITIKRSPEDYYYKKRSIEQQTNVNVTLYNVTIPECLSTITFLCDECFYLDQLVGYSNASFTNAIKYYFSGPFLLNINITKSFLNYTTDPLSTAFAGGTRNCTQRFPSNAHSNLCYFGDSDIKMGFSDVSIYINSLPLPPPSQSVCGGDQSIAFVNTFICPIFEPFIQFFEKFFFNMNSPAVNPGEIFESTFKTIYQCDWINWTDLDGSKKRYSIGETGVIFVVTTFIIAISLSLIFPSHTTAIFSLMFASSATFYLLGGYLILTYNWSYACGLALPVQLGNDLFNFTAFILAPKCEIWLSSLINEEYNNNNCYSCENAESFTFANCRNDLKFEFFWDNVVFILQYYHPEVLDWLRTAPFPFTLLFNIPHFEETLNKFANVNWNDPIQYSQYQACGLGYTLIPNYVIMTGLVFIAQGVLSPAAITVIVSIISQLAFLILLLIQLLQNIYISISYIESRTPYVQAGLLDENGSERLPPNAQQATYSLKKQFPLESIQIEEPSAKSSKKKKKTEPKRKNIFVRVFRYLLFLIYYYSYECYYAISFTSKRRKVDYYNFDKIKRD